MMAKRVEGEDVTEREQDGEAMSAPEVTRAERLARVAEAVRSGTYRVDSSAVAARLIKSMRTPRSTS